jgi:Acetyltransferase (GNAT) domain
LHGTLHVDEVPQLLEDRLGELYESTYSLGAYFDLAFPTHPRGAWHLAEPFHVVEFQVDRSRVTVLNGLFPIDAESLHKFCADVFAGLPDVDRIRFCNLACDPATVGLRFRTDRTVHDWVAALPATPTEYLGALGRNSRQKLAKYVRRVECEHPGFHFETWERDDIDEGIVQEIIALNRQRLAARGEVSGIDTDRERRLQQLARECGLVSALTCGDNVVAGWLGTRVGQHAFFHVTGYCDDYADLHPGLVSCWFTLRSCMDRGVKVAHLLWGDSDYKRRLGFRPRDLYFATIFRSAGARYVHPREEASFRLACLRASDSSLVVLPQRLRWRARRLWSSVRREAASL